ncbi:MAG: hypothetical protein KatS3mg060_3307 [Dehalococcoidia bacterium]|nr:MAG: hypothetical protein KatS3mg060_3307 [Dehalococcoidia bacterium]
MWVDVAPHPATYPVLDGQADLIGPLVDRSEDPLHDIERADAVLASGRFPGTAATFDRASRLRAVARFGAGYETIDLEAATARGICVMNTPDAPTIATAEFTIMLMIAVMRRLLPGIRALEAGGWPPLGDVLGHDLSGKTLGIIGLGRIGSRVARLATAFDMKVVAVDPFVTAERATAAGATLLPALDQLLGIADIVSLHVPASAATHHLLDRAAIARLKPSAVVINVARGTVVDEVALAEALRAGRIAGAAIDVWNPEPPAPNHPLLGLPNVVATPHQAGLSNEGRERSNTEAARQALMVLRGERPPHLLNPEVWDRRR